MHPTAQYKVLQNAGTPNETTVRVGNLRQCWLYVLNSFADDTTAGNLAAQGVCITPTNKEKQPCQ